MSFHIVNPVWSPR